MNIKSKYILLLAFSAAVLGGCGGSDDSEQPASSLVRQIEGDDGKVNMLLPDFTQLVDQAGPAVVNIQASKATGTDSGLGDPEQLPEGDPFYDFFKRLVPNAPQLEQPDDDSGISYGSGFIISSDGYVLTNTHVVAGMSKIKVTLNDKREFTAKLVGSDVKSDVALLKIEAADLPTVKIGSAKSLKTGEWVVAIGAPFGFDNSVTAGIVSAKGRTLPDEQYTSFIQTDVAINPGNSGGPLFNLQGQVIGINSQIFSRSGGFMGISFAIPIDVAMNVADQLKKTGKVQRGQLGVIIQEVNYDLAKSFGLDKPDGALIVQVLPDSPAAQAGLQVGDIVRSANGEPIRSSGELPVIIGSISPGQEITLGIWRKGKEVETKVRVGNASDAVRSGTLPENAQHGDDLKKQSFTVDKIGLTLVPRAENSHTVLMVARAEGLAADAGLLRGDRILTVGQTDVEDESSFKDALSDAGKNVPLLVERGGNTLFLALSLP